VVGVLFELVVSGRGYCGVEVDDLVTVLGSRVSRRVVVLLLGGRTSDLGCVARGSEKKRACWILDIVGYRIVPNALCLWVATVYE
jgi:hypothetical protein